jgi:flagellar biosynthetic protein FliO
MPFKKTLFCVPVLILILLTAQVSPARSEGSNRSASATPTPADVAPSPTPSSEQVSNSVSPTTAASGENSDSLPFMKDSESETHQAPSAAGMLLRTLGALLLIVGLVVAGAWVMKRFGGGRFGKAIEDAPELAVINSVGLGEKRSLAVVRFGERTLLIGSTPQSISLLAETQAKTPETNLLSVADMLEKTPSDSFEEELSIATQYNRTTTEGADAPW